ncbi:MAG: hypothetical protein FJ149_04480 [Euryarchaeota archaeon]|nr:hypothetical protein [Euryarchaeota archaeon]
MDEDEEGLKEPEEEGGRPPSRERPREPSPPLPTPVGPHVDVWRGRGTANGPAGSEPGPDEKGAEDGGQEPRGTGSGGGPEVPEGAPAPEGVPWSDGSGTGNPESGDPRPYREGEYERRRRQEGGREWLHGESPRGDRRDGRGRGGGGRQDDRHGGRRDDGRRDGRGRGGGGRRDDRRDGRHDDGRYGRRDPGGPGHEARPQGGRPPEVDRQLVLPGDVLGSDGSRGGSGTFAEGGTLYAACLGIRSTRDGVTSVIPLSGKYIPRRGDFVVGKVAEMTPSAWIIDLNSPYMAPLPGSETPWDVQFGEAPKYMSLGDTVLVEIRDINEIGRVTVSMNGPNLRKLVGGQTIDVDATKVPRLIGRGGSMIGLLKRLTRCHIIVGQNGRVWLDGTVEDLTIALAAIRKIEADAHKLGLTDAVASFIEGMRRDLDGRKARKERDDDLREKQAIIWNRVERITEEE